MPDKACRHRHREAFARDAIPRMVADLKNHLEHLGEDTVTVAAGTFDCRRLRFVDEGAIGGKQQSADDAFFVQGGVGYMATWYELVEPSR